MDDSPELCARAVLCQALYADGPADPVQADPLGDDPLLRALRDKPRVGSFRLVFEGVLVSGWCGCRVGARAPSPGGVEQALAGWEVVAKLFRVSRHMCGVSCPCMEPSLLFVLKSGCQVVSSPSSVSPLWLPLSPTRARPEPAQVQGARRHPGGA